MASPFSILKRRTEFANPFNADLFGKVVSQKQNILTQNEQALNESISSVANIDLLRDKDKQYLLNNLQGVIDTVNSTDNIDFTNQSQGTRLSSFIRTSIDGEVQKQVANTVKFRAFQTQINTLKEKKPKEYNDLNYQDAIKMSGFESYMKGEKNDYNTISYTPYTNVEENVVKRIKTLKDIMPDQDIEVVLPNGLIAKKKKSALTSSEWEGVILNNMSSQEKNQLSIESRAAYNYNDVAAKEDYQRQRLNLEDPYDDRILELENELVGATGNKKQNLENEIANTQASKTRTLAQLDVSNKDAGTIGAQIKMVNLARKYSKGLGFEVTTGYDYSNLNYLIKVNTQARNIAKFEKEQTLLDLEIAEKRGGLSQSDVNNPSGVVGDFTTRPITTDTEKEKESFINLFDKQKTESVSELHSVSKEIFELLQETPYSGSLKNKGFKTQADAILFQQRKLRDEGRNLSDFEEKAALAAYATQNHMLPADKLAKMHRVFEKAKVLEKLDENAKTGALQQLVENKSVSFYNEMVVERGGENNVNYYTQDGKATKFATVLRNLKTDGVNSAEDFLEFMKGDTFKAKEIKANIALQAGNNLDLGVDERTLGIAGSIIPTLTQNSEHKKTFGEQANNFFGKNYEKVLSEVLSETTNIFREQSGKSFATESDGIAKDLANMFTVEDFKRAQSDLLGKRTATLTGLNEIIIPTGTVKAGQGLNPLHVAVTKLLGNTSFKTNEAYTATLTNEGVKIRQVGTSSGATVNDGIQGFKLKQNTVEGTITLSQLQDNPNLQNLFNDSGAISEINLNEGIDIQMENITYTDYSKSKNIEGFSNLFGKYGQNEVDKLAVMATPKGALNYIKNRRDNSSILQKLSPQKKAFAERGINNMIDNIDKFKVSAEGKGENATLSISVKSKSGKDVIIQSEKFDTKNEKLMDILVGAPEIYITRVLDDAFNEYISDIYGNDPNNQNPDNVVPSNPNSMMALMSASFNQ